MDELVASVQRVSAMIADIAAVSAEQNEGVGQINEAITVMGSATQQNAALVEEAAAAAEAMKMQAADLSKAVRVFKIREQLKRVTAGFGEHAVKPVGFAEVRSLR
ncbi:hypothetical protein [Massilia cavernae]|uniref:Methyl-accepting transducer domain-containing protein n=1 Tax=Massilia cavernae TaxID=2320864 RepID=A0A418XSJ8_9BURK|nr:hypothetical protein [Massilia cavernae]RJG15475.1 hypothetical protein D3872_13220 [Massilia cavernae]